jgi:hypothetical protein
VIATGQIRGWPEATQYLRFDVTAEAVVAEIGTARSQGLDVFWSIATTYPSTGFFYGDSVRGTDETRVAHAVGARRVQDIRDASTLEFTQDSIGPVAVGEIVVIEHVPTQRFLALVIDAIEPTDPWTAGAGPYALADVTWYLSPSGERDFSKAP